MKISLSAIVALLLAAPLVAQVPNLIPHQGRVAVNGANFDGTGLFKFALVNTAGTITYWSNNGSSVAGSQPTAAVSLPVTKGLYSVLLGDTSLVNMTAVPATVYANADLRLRVWFNDGALGFQQLSPDRRLAPNGYLPDGAVTSASLADGSITAVKLAPGAVSQLSASDGSPAAALQVNADGQVGLGTANPLAGLHIAASRTVQNLELASVRRDEAGGFNALDYAWDVVASGNLAAVAGSSDSGVTLMDITDPAAPVLRWQIKDGESGYTNLAGAWKLTMKPGLLAVSANLDDAVTLLDVTDSANPVKRAELRDGVGGYDGLDGTGAIAISGNLLAVVGVVDKTVTLVDITNPAAPVKRAEIVNGAGGYNRLNSPEGLALSGNLLAIGSSQEGVTLVDVTTPAAPVKRAELVTSSPGYEDLRRTTGMAISGGLLAVASQPTDAVILVDVSNPASPVRRAVLKKDVNTTALDGPVAVSLSGTQMLTGGRGRLTLWDVSNPASPVELGTARQHAGGLQTLGDSWSVTIAGSSMLATSGVDSAVNVFTMRARDSSLTTTGWAGFGTAKPEAMLHVVGNVRADAAERVEFNTTYFEAGNGAAANGFGAAAIGFNAMANGTLSFAAGQNAMAQGNYSTAIGPAAAAAGEGSVALGPGSRAQGSRAVALPGATASGSYSTAMGTGSGAAGADSLAAGYESGAIGNAAMAFGYLSLASGTVSMATGLGARAQHDNTFVWSAGTPDFSFGSTGVNQFLIQAPGGVGINTSDPGGAALAVSGNTSITGNLTITGSLTGSGAGLTGLNAAQLTGSISAAALTSVPAANLTGAVPAASLTSVPASSLTGTVNVSSLPSTVALRNAANAFTGNQSITGNLSANGSVNFGPSSSVPGFASVAMGNNASAAGNYSYAFGQSAATTAAAGNSVALGSNATAAHSGSFIRSDGTGNPRSTTAANQFVIHAVGGVGIGTSSPNYPLSLGPSLGNTKLAVFDGGGTAHGLGIGAWQFRLHLDDPASRFSFLNAPAGTELMTVQGSGRVGIGTINPQARLHIHSADNPAVVRIQSSGAPGFGRVEFLSNPQGDANEWRPGYIQSTDTGGFTGGLSFVTNGTGSGNRFGEVEAMRLQNGSVGIGRIPAVRKLEVEGEASKATSGGWFSNSDRRIKTDIRPVTGALQTLDKVKPVTFRYTQEYRRAHPGIDDGLYYNVLAQEFRDAFPESVQDSGEKMPDGSSILQVDTYPATITAIAAIKELKAAHDTLRRQKDAEISELKAENEALTTRLDKLERALENLRSPHAAGK